MGSRAERRGTAGSVALEVVVVRDALPEDEMCENVTRCLLMQRLLIASAFRTEDVKFRRHRADD